MYDPQPGAAWQLLVGDETALPAIGAIIERIEEGQSLRAFVEADTLRNAVMHGLR